MYINQPPILFPGMTSTIYLFYSNISTMRINYTMFKAMSSSSISFLYLIIEGKGHKGYFMITENQAFVSGRIILDMTWPVLGDQDVIFLFSTMPYLAHMFVMWRDVQTKDKDGEDIPRCPTYNIKLIDNLYLVTRHRRLNKASNIYLPHPTLDKRR
ncbi:hypothetical protein F4813DRAFT_102343 [Daldinia decipiens]|uniref:uncharacterized protein n=1 Tax=Daldinia decipiens TaxID=326647 RepID=UPI0020C56E84|nr:uncharacterized protein F4813DRAFT_102343 [Daldinia decipiens]KAI1662209.1 hypothetical protein F4813DRAFT_102343 [Daldinia decipiens]